MQNTTNILWKRLQSRRQIISVVVLPAQRSYSKRAAYYHQVGDEPLVYRTVAQQLYRTVQENGKRLALISRQENIRMTFDEVAAEAERFAFKLQALGMKRGDHLGIWAPNTAQWYLTFLAAAIGGFPLVCINPALQTSELEYSLQKAKVKTLVTMSVAGKQNFERVINDMLDVIPTNATERISSKKLPILERILIKPVAEKLDNQKSGDSKAEFMNYDQLMGELVPSHQVALMKTKIDSLSPESICNIQFTSGTTGKPKVTLITHFNYVNLSYYMGINLRMHESHKSICLTVPCFHAFGLGVIMGALHHASTLVMPSASFNSVAALEAIEADKCNIVVGTPTMYVDMLEKQSVLKKCTKSLQVGLVGGAACSPEVFLKTRELLDLPDMRVGYGLSECTVAVFMQNGTLKPEVAAATVGKPIKHLEIKIVNEKGETVEFGEKGELCVRGFSVMRGYFEDEKATNETLVTGGWLRTGDEFILEANGIGRFIGRKKEMIIRGGENIFPKEIEDFLDTHETILESQVIGVPDERMGEEMCAYLRLRPGTKQLTIDDIREFCKGRIAHFKVPRYVRVVEDFPKTTSGKIQKFKLLELFKNE